MPNGPAIQVGAPSAVGLDSSRLDRITEHMRTLVKTKCLPNAMALVARHGQVAYCHGEGLQNEGTAQSATTSPVALREDTIFRIYSLTKPITGVALMMLYEEGKFCLADPVHLYLGTRWKKSNMRVYQSGSLEDGDFATEDCNTDITIKHLLTHTSGLSMGANPKGNPVDALYQRDLFPKIYSGSASLKHVADLLVEMPLLFQPGTHFTYSMSADMCGMLVEAISGVPFERFLEERIFRPLGMIDTSFWLPAEKSNRFADCHVARPDGSIANQTTTMQFSHFLETSGVRIWPAGGGGLLSTMHDFMRFCMMLSQGGELCGERLLSVKTIEWMATNHLPDGKDMAELMLPWFFNEVPGPGDGWGLQFTVIQNPQKTQTINSTGSFGWAGAAGTYFWIDPQEELFAIWYTQLWGMDLEKKTRLRSQIKQLVYGSIVDRKPFQRGRL